MNLFIDECSRNNLSIVAIDLASGKVAGAFLVKDYTFLVPFSEQVTNNCVIKVLLTIDEKMLSEVNHPVKTAL